MSNTLPVFSLVTVYPAPSGGTTISWKLDRAYAPTVDSEFTGFHVEWSMPGGSWTQVTTSAITDANSYTDTTKRTTGMLDDSMYRVVMMKGSADEVVSQPVGAFGNVSRNDWTIARGMLRDQYYELQRVKGVGMLWLPRMQYGTACTRCLNPDSDQPLSPRCTVCYGTGFVGGYYGSHAALGHQVKPLATSRQYSDQGPMVDSGQQELDLPGYPDVAVKDLFMDTMTGNRFEVLQQSVTGYYRGIPVRQKAILNLLPKSAIEYDVPLTPANDGWTTGISMFARLV